MAKNYEAVIFMKPTLSEAEIAATVAKAKKAVDDMKGAFIEEKAPEKKKLPYVMKKFRDGFQYFIKFSAEPSAIVAIRDRFKHTEEIIRSMISCEVVIPVVKEEPRKPRAPKPEGAQEQVREVRMKHDEDVPRAEEEAGK